ncbi:alpha/beta hydrolase family protein [Streptantibioticus cattleyicolor]|uniref:alpha/beta hydrolase family protein n=1 Tax=Streptantibioticus cattleyicolor TaxID=29303 RepID=UPI0005A0FF89|nr:acetylhydrolase [Streptantibioticus cattleyicolor]
MTRIRRTAAAAVLALVLPLPVLAAVPASAAAPVAASETRERPAQLPRPTGPYAVGREILHLVDEHRQDPWVPSAGPRQLMVSMYYPARPGTGGPAPYMTIDAARMMLQMKLPGTTVPPELVSGTRTWSRTGARPEHGRFPLVVLSPGFTMPRTELTSLAEELTSRGYVVALVDHTYENSGTTFPDGRTLPCAICDKPPAGGPGVVAESRAKDISFVIDQLTSRHPAWRYAHLIDARRIGVAGHSLGGDAAVTTMAADKRVRAGVNLDGTMFAPVPGNGLGGRPFMLMGHALPAGQEDETWTSGWAHLDGWKRWLTVNGANHSSFTDLQILADRIGVPEPPGTTISAPRSVQLTRTYVGAFFDLHLKGIAQPVLDGPTAADPEVTFHP